MLPAALTFENGLAIGFVTLGITSPPRNKPPPPPPPLYK